MSSSVNSYASLSEFKAILGITATTDDVALRKNLEAASRAIETYCNRYFYCLTATKVFDGALTLWIPDLLSVTTLKTDEDGDYDYDNSFATTDYILYGVGLEDTLNSYPKIRIEIDYNGDYSSFASGYPKGVQIAGVWGYGDGTSATPYVADTDLSGAIANATDTTCTVTSATNLSAGQTILIGTEQLYITGISTLTLTVERGVNGSTAAAHLINSRLYIYRYPRDIYQACIMYASRMWLTQTKPFASETLGDYSYSISNQLRGISTGLSENERAILQSYRRMRF